MLEKLSEGWQCAMAIILTMKAVIDLAGAVAYEKGSEALVIPIHTVVRFFNYNESVDSPEPNLESGTLADEGDPPAKLVWIDCVLDLPSATFSKAKQLWGFALPTRRQDASTNDRVSSNQHNFRVDQTGLAELFQLRDGDRLQMMGGVAGVASALRTDMEKGIDGDAEDVHLRVKEFGRNVYLRRPKREFLSFMWDAFKDVVLATLLFCAAFLLGIHIKKQGLREGCYHGGSIFFAVFAVIMVLAAYNFWQCRQFDWLCGKNDIRVEVLRSGRPQNISIYEIVVGDVVCLNIGDQIPADGLFLDGYSLQIDGYDMTGESGCVEVDSNRPFLSSGWTVADGYGRMLVISVGMNTEWGLLMSSITHGIREEIPPETPLKRLNFSVRIVGLSVTILTLLALLIHYFTGNTRDEDGSGEFNPRNRRVDDIGISIVGNLASAAALAFLFISQGLPLALTFTLACSMKRMMADKAMPRNQTASEAMSFATTICTDKTGILTRNSMTVTEFWLGQLHMADGPALSVHPDVLNLIQLGVASNTAGNIYRLQLEPQLEFSGSPTEKAILSWAVEQLHLDMEEIKQRHSILRAKVFNSHWQRSGVTVRNNIDGEIHVHFKGDAELILSMCEKYYHNSGNSMHLGGEQRTDFQQIVRDMASRGLRCIGFAHRQLCPNSYAQLPEDNLTLLCLIGIRNPCRSGVKDGISICQQAGINIKMITADHTLCAEAIATECGILGSSEELSGEAVVEGEVFRSYTDEERLQKIDKIKVMSKSSPCDKLLMIQCLNQKGHVVAVTGSNIDDGPALRAANIGLSMGITGTEAAKKCSDIIILDDNFVSITKAVRRGRCIQQNVRKFIQFQLTALASALAITVVTVVFSGSMPLTVVQLLWVSQIVHILGAVALNTEQPTDDLMQKHPMAWNDPLITNIMWRNLVAQASYQVTIHLIVQFKGEQLLCVDHQVKTALIFNTLILCQVFNLFNCRKLEEINVFKGTIIHNKWLLAVSIEIILTQVVMIEISTRFLGTERLNLKQWGACIAMAAVSWPLCWVVKCIPVPERHFKSYMKWMK